MINKVSFAVPNFAAKGIGFKGNLHPVLKSAIEEYKKIPMDDVAANDDFVDRITDKVKQIGISKKDLLDAANSKEAKEAELGDLFNILAKKAK